MVASNVYPVEMGRRGVSAESPRPSILVIDDSIDSANSLCCLLGVHGYTIDVAYHWADALSTARTQCPDVILLDLGMPEMDGVHLARFFRDEECLKQTVIIAVTGYDDDLRRAQCASAGIDFVLRKPVPWEVLHTTIHRLWPNHR